MSFCIVTPYRNSQYIQTTITSVLNQTYTDWKMIVIDDNSDNPIDNLSNMGMSLSDDRITYIYNNERKYALRNIVESVWRYAGYNDIIVCLDGDDFLHDNKVLEDIEAEYIRTGSDALWTSYIDSNGQVGVSREMTHNPLVCGWTMSHLRTFKKYLIDGIRPETFLDENGDWWKCAYDQALYRPILFLAQKPVFYNRVCMVYNIGQGDNQQEKQKEAARLIQNKLLKEFSYKKKNVVFIVNGKSEGCDKRFHQGERRLPLGVLTMMGHLIIRGHMVALIDRFACPDHWNQELIDQADVIGVSCTTPNFPDAMKCLERLQQYRGKKLIVVGGAHAILHPEQFKQHADVVSVSEADFEISRIVEDGKAYNEKTRLDNLDCSPMPIYNFITYPIERYTRTWDFDDSTDVITMNTSRSCPHSCSFCDVKKIWGKKWVAKSAERVLNDIEHVAHLSKSIYFREDNFSCSRKRLVDICNGIINRGLKIKWACEMRADSCDEEILSLMAKSGCVGVYVGAESGSDRMLKIYNKCITRQQIIDACLTAKNFGINVLMSIIEKHPDETKEDVELTESMIKICEPKKVNRCDYRSE